MVEQKKFRIILLACCLVGLSIFAELPGLKPEVIENMAPLAHILKIFRPVLGVAQTIKYSNDDWIITGSETVENETIVLESNLIIESGGSLTLKNVTLLVEQKPQDIYKILAKPGSSLFIFNSTIAPSQKDYRFAFIITGAQFVLKQSKLEGLGKPYGYSPGGGLIIYDTNGTIIEDNTINHHESYGISITDSSNISLKNNTIICTGPDETSGAINLDNSHNNTITYNHLYRQWDAIHLQSSWNNYIAYNELTLTNHTIGISVWYGSGNNVIEYNNISAHEGYDMV